MIDASYRSGLLSAAARSRQAVLPGHRRAAPANCQVPRQRGTQLPNQPDGTMEAVHSGYATDVVAADAPSMLSTPNGTSIPAAAHVSEKNIQWRQHQKQALPPLVDRMLSSTSLECPEGTDPKQLLRVMEAFWTAMKGGQAVAAPTVVQHHRGSRLHTAAQYDVAVAGGTLGILLAVALQARGHRVVVIERRKLQGRNQEWNIGRGELQRLVECGLLTQHELDACVVSQFGPVRVGFKGSPLLDCGPDVLDCGVCPRLLLDVLRRKFLAAGGELLEETAFKAAAVLDDGVEVELLPGRAGAPGVQPGDVNRPMALKGRSAAAGAEGATTQGSSGSGSSNSRGPVTGAHRRSLTARLLVDCMGHYSPIVKQLRGKQKPDGIVLVVGGAWLGFRPDHNTAADLLYTFTDASDGQQLFWEAFPAAGGARTLYMFQYTDADPSRPTFAQLLDTYLRLLPQYQGVSLDQLQPQRILMGSFPCYADSPLKPGWDRVLQMGDAAGAQSPLSFGGFSSLVRHLPCLVAGVSEALEEERLSRGELGWLQPYQPCLSAAFLLQRAMAPRPGQLAVAPTSSASNVSSRSGWLPPDHINRLLSTNFSVLRMLGDATLRPFLQDTLRFFPLALMMVGMMLRDPICMCRVLVQLGPRLLLTWMGHFAALAAYTLAHKLLKPLRPLTQRSWHFRRLLDALEWGSGSS